MDEQNPRVGTKRVRGRASEELTGRQRETSTTTPKESIGSTPDTRYGSADPTSSTAPYPGSPEYAVRPTTDEPPERRTREIRAEIEQTREDMSETVNAIQERLRPSTVASNAVEGVKHAAQARFREVADFDSVTYIAANPIPTAMVGIGIAGAVWLATAGREGRSRRSRRAHRAGYSDDWGPQSYGYERFGGNYPRGSAGESPDLAYGSARFEPDAARERRLTNQRTPQSDDWRRLGSSGSSHLRTMGSVGATRGYRAAQTYVQRAWYGNPLLVGAASAVLGAIVGLGIPETEGENELMGETRDNMIESVQETVREKVDQVQQAATNAMSTVQDAAKAAVGLTGSDAPSMSERRGSEGTS
jgi:Protein of unknown function (DUF3618)